MRDFLRNNAFMEKVILNLLIIFVNHWVFRITRGSKHGGDLVGRIFFETFSCGFKVSM